MKTETLHQVPTIGPGAAATVSLDDVIATAAPVIQLKNILVPVDFSEMSLKSLQYAVPFARQFESKLTLLHVIQPAEDAVQLGYPAFFASKLFAEVEKRLEDVRATMVPSELAVDILVRHNFVFDGILEAAHEVRADLIITTTHGYSGLKHLMMGSTAENIVRRAPCSVLVVREVEHDFV